MSTQAQTQEDAFEATAELSAEVDQLVRQWGDDEDRKLVLRRLGAIADVDPRRALALVGRLIEIFDYYACADLCELLIAAYVDRDSTEAEVVHDVAANEQPTANGSPAAVTGDSEATPPPAPSDQPAPDVHTELTEGRY